MKAVMLEPGREARALDIPHTLKAMQQAVGGTIQAIYPWKGVSATLVCDDEGLLKRLPFNRSRRRCLSLAPASSAGWTEKTSPICRKHWLNAL